MVKKYIKKTFVRFIQAGSKWFIYDKESQIIDFKNIDKILIICLEEIGDIVLTSPLLRELRKNYSEAKITLIVKPQVYNLVELCPYVDEILIYRRDSIHASKMDFFLQMYKTFFFAKKYFRNNKYDLAIVPRWDLDGYFASYIAYFSKAKIRLAYSENVNEMKQNVNPGYDGFFTDVIDDRMLKHEVERKLYFIDYLQGNIQKTQLEVWINKSDIEWADQFLKTRNLKDEEILIALFPSARNKRREWDINKFVKLVNLLITNMRIKILLLGDEKNTGHFRNSLMTVCQDNIIDCIGKTTIRQTIALLKRTNFYLGGDTGPMHLAVACGLSGVVISCHPQDGDGYNENAPERFGPWQSDMVVVRPKGSLDDCLDGCQKNYAHCINQITVDEVYKAFENILKGNS